STRVACAGTWSSSASSARAPWRTSWNGFATSRFRKAGRCLPPSTSSGRGGRACLIGARMRCVGGCKGQAIKPKTNQLCVFPVHDRSLDRWWRRSGSFVWPVRHPSYQPEIERDQGDEVPYIDRRRLVWCSNPKAKFVVGAARELGLAGTSICFVLAEYQPQS